MAVHDLRVGGRDGGWGAGVLSGGSCCEFFLGGFFVGLASRLAFPPVPFSLFFTLFFTLFFRVFSVAVLFLQ